MGVVGLRQADPGERLHALLRADRRDARQHGRLRHRPGHGAAAADGRDAQEGRRSLITAAFMDLPIAAAFTSSASCSSSTTSKDPRSEPAANADVFGSYILNVMPVGIRGLVLAGVFATAMGSLSAALNALATSATNDWYIPYVARPRRRRTTSRAARWFTVALRGADDRHRRRLRLCEGDGPGRPHHPRRARHRRLHPRARCSACS